jgi:hypothetical protein
MFFVHKKKGDNNLFPLGSLPQGFFWNSSYIQNVNETLSQKKGIWTHASSLGHEKRKGRSKNSSSVRFVIQ